MTELETRLRDVRLAEPPLGFDPDELADRAAKQARTRAAGIAVTVVAGAAVAAAALFGPGPAPAPPAAGPVPPSLADQARIRQALTDAVTRLFPGLRSLSVGTSPADAITPAGMSATATFVDAAGQQSTFQLTVRRAQAAVSPDQVCFRAGSAAHCTKQPDGAVLVVSETSYRGQRLGLDGFLYRPDGSRVILDQAGGESWQLTEEQVTQVITDPAFVLP